MAGFNPSMVSFAGGEISPRLHGRVDSELYRKALRTCSNFIPRAHGSALMRAGSIAPGVALASTDPRLVPFNVSGSEPYGLLLTNGALEIRNYLGASEQLYQNLVSNGSFHAGTTGWTLAPGSSGSAAWQAGGYVRLTKGTFGTGGSAVQTGLVLVGGSLHTVKVRIRGTGGFRIAVFDGTTTFNFYPSVTGPWQTLTYTFTPVSGTPATNSITLEAWNLNADAFLDDVQIQKPIAAVYSFAAPWTAAQLAGIQYDQDLTKNRMLLVHGDVAPQLLSLNAHGMWEFGAASFVAKPADWGGSTWPSIIEWGYQGRLWLGACPTSPNIFNGSKSGLPFDFTPGGTTASDAVEFNASVRGALRWMQGQKSLLLGAERVEQAAHGGTGIITPSSIQVEDESAFGSAAIQAAHMGDEVIFVGRDRKEVRGLSFDAQVKSGWVSRPLSFIAEHLLAPQVKEIHFASRPDPMILALLDDGTVVGCVYDRAENVTAWWRMAHSGVVKSCCVVETTLGSELWIAIMRGTSAYQEIVPLHEDGVVYLDAARTGIVAAGGIYHVYHLPANSVVRVIIDGEDRGDFTLVGDELHMPPADEGKTFTAGLAYQSRMVQLPLEGGLAGGSSQTAKRRVTKARLRLNNSAIPLVNGKRAAERLPADPMDTGTDLFTGDVDYQVLGWEEDGALTIEQDLPFRTEILAVYTNAQVNEV